MECVLSAPPAGVVKRDTSVADGRFFSQTWPDERRAGVVSRVQVECGGVVRVDAKRLKHQEPDGIDAGHACVLAAPSVGEKAPIGAGLVSGAEDGESQHVAARRLPSSTQIGQLLPPVSEIGFAEWDPPVIGEQVGPTEDVLDVRSEEHTSELQ